MDRDIHEALVEAGLDDEPVAPRKAPEPWTLEEAVDLCRKIEEVCPTYGCHVALTGGTLYKDGPRKDVDLLFYRIRQVDEIDIEALFSRLRDLYVNKTGGWGWCHKAEYLGKRIDIFFPEEQGGEEYTPGPVATSTDEEVVF